MLSQRACVERFLARRKGQASGLVSTGEKLLDYGWYELAAWRASGYARRRRAEELRLADPEALVRCVGV